MTFAITFILLTALSVYLGLCFFMYFWQRKLLFFPSPPKNIVDKNSYLLSVDNAQLKIWHDQQQSNEAIIYFGGNAEDVSNNINDFERIFANKNLYILNYRGYGGSSGEPSQKAFFEDALALYDSISAKYHRISVIGRSLGTGVATYLCSQRKVDRLVLVTPYDSITKVGQSKYPFLPVALLIKDTFNSAAIAPQILIPTLMILAEKDALVLPQRSHALIKNFSPSNLNVITIEGAGHNFSLASEHHQYLSALEQFLNKTPKL